MANNDEKKKRGLIYKGLCWLLRFNAVIQANNPLFSEKERGEKVVDFIVMDSIIKEDKKKWEYFLYL